MDRLPALMQGQGARPERGRRIDRLRALIIVLGLGAVACDEGVKPGEPPSRVNAAKVGMRQTATTDAFCDVHAAGDKAAAFTWPALAGSPPAATKSWRWVNVWATWCKPCIEEMPRLQRWRDKLKSSHPIELVFVSVDESDADVAAFRKLHPETPTSARIADTKTQESWFARLGLTGAPPIPIHILVDPENRIRCVRAGGVRDQDYAVIERLLVE